MSCTRSSLSEVDRVDRLLTDGVMLEFRIVHLLDVRSYPPQWIYSAFVRSQKGSRGVLIQTVMFIEL
jgi:hypothetical protein